MFTIDDAVGGATPLRERGAEPRFGFGPQDHDFSRRVVEQPGYVSGAEAGGPVGAGRDHDPVVAFVGDRAPQGVPVVAAELDPRVDRNAGLAGPLFDRLLERQSEVAL